MNPNGFGAPASSGARRFIVDIPSGHTAEVRICEDLGFDPDSEGSGVIVERAGMTRKTWIEIRDFARDDFNRRLKDLGQKPGSWRAGIVPLDRFLGRELCVLAWAADQAALEQCPTIGQRWSALRPEERWWLFWMASAEAGRAGQRYRGWRRAIYHALSDGRASRLLSSIPASG